MMKHTHAAAPSIKRKRKWKKCLLFNAKYNSMKIEVTDLIRKILPSIPVENYSKVPPNRPKW